jgi:hypothetical protein
MKYKEIRQINENFEMTRPDDSVVVVTPKELHKIGGYLRLLNRLEEFQQKACDIDDNSILFGEEIKDSIGAEILDILSAEKEKLEILLK